MHASAPLLPHLALFGLRARVVTIRRQQSSCKLKRCVSSVEATAPERAERSAPMGQTAAPVPPASNTFQMCVEKAKAVSAGSAHEEATVLLEYSPPRAEARRRPAS